MQSATVAPQTGVISTTAVPALLAASLGLFLLWGVGFAQADALHNAAHDARHSAAFPCH